jgi:hypothetical protein
MSSIYSWGVPVSVPPVHDTTPCMDYMLAYEECLVDAVPRNSEVFHPNWPTLWPRLLTDGRLRPDLIDDRSLEKGPTQDSTYRWNKPLEESVKEKLWECEEERFLFKGCLRKLIRLQQDKRTRLPVFQPEENVYKAMPRRIHVNEKNRYPSDRYLEDEECDTDHMRWRWRKFVQNEEDVS